MRKFLNDRKAVNNDYNFISLQNGKYNISPDDKDQFFDLFTKCPWRQLPSLVFKPQDRYGPAYIDVDIVRSNKECNNHDILYHVADIAQDEILKLFPKYHPEISITCRPESYFKPKNKKHPEGWAFGGHIIFHGWFSKNFCGVLYTKLLENEKLQTLMKDPNIVNVLSDIIDPAPTKRSNGLILIGDHKPGNLCPPHQLVVFENTEVENKRITVPQMQSLYNWLFEQPDKSDLIYDVQPPIRKVSVKQGNTTPNNHSTFNLKLFLELTKTHIPTNQEWKQLCCYFASEHLDPQEVENLTNVAWNPSNKNETSNYMRKLIHFGCGIGSAINYLHLYSTTHWIREEVFGTRRQRFKYYNEVEQFTLAKGKAWALNTIHQFFQDVFVWVQGDANFRFIYKEEKISRSYDREIKQVNTCVVNESPFKGIANLSILCNRSRKDLFERLEHMKKPKLLELPEATTPKDKEINKRLTEKNNNEFVRYDQAQRLLL